jgi:hypothetical protein
MLPGISGAWAWHWGWWTFDCACHACAISDKIMKDRHEKGIKFGGSSECPKLDFPGLIIYIYSYRFTVSKDKKEIRYLFDRT